MSSNAWTDLATRLTEVRTLAALDPARSGAATQTPLGNALNRACLVMLSAHVEGYLEDLMAEAIDALVSTSMTVDAIPLLLRALHTESHLKQIEQSKDRNARAPRIEQLFSTEAPIWVMGATLKASMLRATTVCAEMSNPGSREIAQFLNLIGVDIEGHLATTGASQLLGQVNGLVHRRNAVAHGDATATATHVDVDSYLTIVERLANEIDIAVAKGVRTTSGSPQLPW